MPKRLGFVFNVASMFSIPDTIFSVWEWHQLILDTECASLTWMLCITVYSAHKHIHIHPHYSSSGAKQEKVNFRDQLGKLETNAIRIGTCINSLSQQYGFASVNEWLLKVNMCCLTSFIVLDTTTNVTRASLYMHQVSQPEWMNPHTSSNTSFCVHCMAWPFWTFYNKSHNIKELGILSHLWSPLTCLYDENYFLGLCASFWSILVGKNSPRLPMQITWPWPPVGSFNHGMITVRQKKMWT